MDLKSFIDTRRRSEPDLVLFIIIFLLAGTGIAMCYSSSAPFAMRVFGDSYYFLKRQLLWVCLGFFVLILFQEIDYRFYLKHTKFMLLVSIIMLVLVLIPGVGINIKGSMRWLGAGGLGIQPSEFVKVFMVIYLVKVFSSEERGHQLAQILIPMVIIACMFILIMMQPDFGTAMDLLIVSVLILFVSGFPLLYIISLFMISIPMFYLLIYQVNYRRERIKAFIDPWKDRFGNGYHIIQSFIAFKRGGLFGVGLGHGVQKLVRLPEPHTDFVFAVIAEESGMLGTVFIVGLYALFFWRGICISMETADDFGRLLAVGLSLLITVQAFINIGVVSGGLPTTGIPLPFISYGGSSMLSSMMACGILLNISRFRERAFEMGHKTGEVWQ